MLITENFLLVWIGSRKKNVRAKYEPPMDALGSTGQHL